MYERYSRFRDARGMTDARVAEATGISKATLSEWRHGGYQPKVDKLIKIADLFGITLDELVRGGNENIGERSGEAVTD